MTDCYNFTDEEEQEVRSKCFEVACKIIRPIIDEEFNQSELNTEGQLNSKIVQGFLFALVEIKRVRYEMDEIIKSRHPEYKNSYGSYGETSNLAMTVFSSILLGCSDKEIINFRSDTTCSAYLLRSLVNTCKALDAYDSISCVMGDEETDHFREYNAKKLMALPEMGAVNES